MSNDPRERLIEINDDLNSKTIPLEEEKMLRNEASALVSTLMKVSADSNSLILPPQVDLQKSKGTYKYALVTCRLHSDDNKVMQFIRGDRTCGYHFEAAEQVVPLLENNVNCHSIEIVGGGRIHMDPDNKQCEVYGYSVQFGRAPHEEVVELIKRWDFAKEFDVSWSNEGY
eukprot:GHVH01007362.1.p1 GENE.GHVH01007362.1~~GHVH01007362.1.p1  ORF type:complete len:171 (+),score=29.25 GHVH01007362.1:39-551(+)